MHVQTWLYIADEKKNNWLETGKIPGGGEAERNSHTFIIRGCSLRKEYDFETGRIGHGKGILNFGYPKGK